MRLDVTSGCLDGRHIGPRVGAGPHEPEHGFEPAAVQPTGAGLDPDPAIDVSIYLRHRLGPDDHIDQHEARRLHRQGELGRDIEETAVNSLVAEIHKDAALRMQGDRLVHID